MRAAEPPISGSPHYLRMLNEKCEMLDCRSRTRSDDFRTFKIQHSSLNIPNVSRQSRLSQASTVAAEALMNNAGENKSIIVLCPR
jgi:hypothetical protein